MENVPLIKLFKKHLGETFVKILREIRVAKAQQYLIEEPSLLIYEFADKCGFREQKRLYEAFIKVLELPRFGGEFRACVSSLFLMQFFISYRRMVGNGRMPAMRIIPSFNIGEDG